MLRMFARRMFGVRVAGSTDRVLAGISLPSDSVIHDIKIKGHIGMAANGSEFTATQVLMYALEAWILPVFDPDAGDDLNTIWDTLVPKDSDVQTLDLDTGTVDSTPFYEPGEADWSAIMDVGFRPQRLYHSHRMLHMGNTTGMRFVDSQTPFETKWQPGANFQHHDRKRYRVRQPSVLVLGAASPDMDDTAATEPAAAGEQDWARTKYMGDTLHQALMDVLGITEAGAETPWEEAADLVQSHLDPDVFESDAGLFIGAALAFHGEMNIDHSVVGEIPKAMLTTGR